MWKKIFQKFCMLMKKAYLCTAFFRQCLSTGFREAEIAQLVEHNLAKVGVAGPSPVFRSNAEKNVRGGAPCEQEAQMAELVDAHVSGACVERCAGSSPVLGTAYFNDADRMERWRNW